MSLLAVLKLPPRTPNASPATSAPDAESARLRVEYTAKMKQAVVVVATVSDADARKRLASTLATADMRRLAAEKAALPKDRVKGLKDACDLLDTVIDSVGAAAAKAAARAPASDAPVALPVAAVPPGARDASKPAAGSKKEPPATETKEVPQSISTKFNFDASPKEPFAEGKLGKYVKGEASLKLEGSAEISRAGAENKVSAGSSGVPGAGNLGFKAEIEAFKGQFATTLIGSKFTEWKTTVAFELTLKKVEINVAVGFKIQTPLPWLAAIGTIKFKLVEADWEKLSKDEQPKIAAIEISGGTQLERTITSEELKLAAGLFQCKVSVELTLAGQVSPDWAEIFADVAKDVAKEAAKRAAKEAAKQAAKEAAKQAAKKAAEEAAKQVAKEAAKDAALAAGEGAGETAIVMDGAALASAAAAILLPAAVAVAIAAGMIQEARNMKADGEAIQTGLSTRKRAAKAASNYAKVLTGGSGSGEGAQEAEAHIADMMKKANATREQVIDAVGKAQGNFSSIRTRELGHLKDKMYADACQAFDDGHKSVFGYLERMGPNSGYRGSFRRMLSIILYADD